jgi:uncharacterized protein YodC (DUF2158 family)
MSFNAGDLVQLKSGGPIMTVQGPSVHEGMMLCSYFDGKKMISEHIAPAALEKAEKPPVPTQKVSARPLQ